MKSEHNKRLSSRSENSGKKDGKQVNRIRRTVEEINQPDPGATNENAQIDPRSELNREDKEALGPKDLSMDMGEDEQLLKHRPFPVDFSGKDLDVPGAGLDDEMENIGSEDEENNIYGIGGDRHEDLEEDKS